MKDYFEKYYPRFDMYNGEKIPFEDLETYFIQDYLTRENMVLHLQKINKKSAFEECVRLIQVRKTAKDLIYAPSTVETRTKQVPSPALCAKIGIDYNQICKEAGLHTRYDYSQKLERHAIERGQLKIIRDTREQQDVKFTAKIIDSGLNFGDYCITENENLFQNVYVERKAPLDFTSSFTAQKDRLVNEIERAKNFNAYLVFLCEKPISVMMGLENSSYYSRHTKVTGSYLFHHVSEIAQYYSNVQFVFCHKENVGEFIEDIFMIKNDIRTLDLQYYVDTKQWK